MHFAHHESYSHIVKYMQGDVTYEPWSYLYLLILMISMLTLFVPLARYMGVERLSERNFFMLLPAAFGVLLMFTPFGIAIVGCIWSALIFSDAPIMAKVIGTLFLVSSWILSILGLTTIKPKRS